MMGRGASIVVKDCQRLNTKPLFVDTLTHDRYNYWSGNVSLVKDGTNTSVGSWM